MAAVVPDGVSAPLAGRCAFFVSKKKRYCKMVVGNGKLFCGEHANAVCVYYLTTSRMFYLHFSSEVELMNDWMTAGVFYWSQCNVCLFIRMKIVRGRGSPVLWTLNSKRLVTIILNQFYHQSSQFNCKSSQLY